MDNPDHFDAYNDSSFVHKANSFIGGEDEISWGTPWRLGSHSCYSLITFGSMSIGSTDAIVEGCRSYHFAGGDEPRARWSSTLASQSMSRRHRRRFSVLYGK